MFNVLYLSHRLMTAIDASDSMEPTIEPQMQGGSDDVSSVCVICLLSRNMRPDCRNKGGGPSTHDLVPSQTSITGCGRAPLPPRPYPPICRVFVILNAERAVAKSDLSAA